MISLKDRKQNSMKPLCFGASYDTSIVVLSRGGGYKRGELFSGRLCAERGKSAFRTDTKTAMLNLFQHMTVGKTLKRVQCEVEADKHHTLAQRERVGVRGQLLGGLTMISFRKTYLPPLREKCPKGKGGAYD